MQNTQQTLETNIHVLSEIRTPGPSNVEAADLHIRSHGDRNWPHCVAVVIQGAPDDGHHRIRTFGMWTVLY